MITFIIQKNDIILFDEVKNKCPEQVHFIDNENSLDMQSFMQVIIELSENTIPLLIPVIINHILNHKIEILINGKKVTAYLKERLTFEQLMEILSTNADEEDNE